MYSPYQSLPEWAHTFHPPTPTPCVHTVPTPQISAHNPKHVYVVYGINVHHTWKHVFQSPYQCNHNSSHQYFKNIDGNIYIAITPNKVAVITILYLKLLLYFPVNNNKENMPIATARNDPLEKVKSKFINESIRRNVFIVFSIKYFFESSAVNNLYIQIKEYIAQKIPITFGPPP